MSIRDRQEVKEQLLRRFEEKNEPDREQIRRRLNRVITWAIEDGKRFGFSSYYKTHPKAVQYLHSLLREEIQYLYF